METKDNSSRNILIVLFLGSIIFVALIFSGAFSGPKINNNNQNNNPTIPNDDITNFTSLTDLCIQHSNLVTHFHFKLIIFIFGSFTTIPANIGVTNDCMKVMHTHSADNLVHVEIPSGYTSLEPTLGDFFIIWGRSLSSTELLEVQVQLQ